MLYGLSRKKGGDLICHVGLQIEKKTISRLMRVLFVMSKRDTYCSGMRLRQPGGDRISAIVQQLVRS